MEKKYQQLFFQEADEKIADLNAFLLVFEKNQHDAEALNELMRAAHTLKSSASAMEYDVLSKTAHEMEDLFEIVRTDKKILSTNAVEVLFAATDALQFALMSLKNGDDPASSAALLSRIHVRIKKIQDDKEWKDSDSDSDVKKEEEPPIDIKVTMPSAPTEGENNTSTQNTEPDSPVEERVQKKSVPTQKTEADSQVQESQQKEDTPTQSQEPDTQGEEEAESEHENKDKDIEQPDVSEMSSLMPISNIKVNVKTLDTLMNLTEELLVENMRFAEIVRLKKEKPDVPIALGMLENSKDALNRLVTDLQYHVTQSRMLPIGQVLERFPRLIRDLSKKVDKTVNFNIVGQEIELDRTVIDRIGEPLIHLIRNAVDHGIADDGAVSVHASRMKDTVIISVENTGQSINWDTVVAAAVKRHMISPEKAQGYLDILHADTNTASSDTKYRVQSQLKHLLFHPQFSIKETVSETSGRGVGLHIVKTVVESFGGTVSVESPVSNTGEGTKFTLQLPLTLAIIQAMLVRVSDQTFAVPFAQIDRTVRIDAGDITTAFDQEIAVVEDEDVPIIRLRDVFQLNAPTRESEEKEHTGGELMLITKPTTHPIAGLIVDELIAEQDIVVKPLKGILQSTSGFAGITLLGDGKPALILDVSTLI